MYELTPAAYTVLRKFLDHKTMTVTDIADQMELPRRSARTQIEHLLKGEWVEATPYVSRATGHIYLTDYELTLKGWNFLKAHPSAKIDPVPSVRKILQVIKLLQTEASDFSVALIYFQQKSLTTGQLRAVSRKLYPMSQAGLLQLVSVRAIRHWTLTDQGQRRLDNYTYPNISEKAHFQRFAHTEAELNETRFQVLETYRTLQQSLGRDPTLAEIQALVSRAPSTLHRHVVALKEAGHLRQLEDPTDRAVSVMNEIDRIKHAVEGAEELAMLKILFLRLIKVVESLAMRQGEVSVDDVGKN